MLDTDVVDDWLVAVVCGVYFIAAVVLWAFRGNQPRDWLQTRIWSLQAQLPTDAWQGVRYRSGELENVQKWIGGLLPRMGRIQAGWRVVHSIEDGHVLELPSEVVDEQLVSMETALAEIPDAQAKDLSARIKKSLEGPADGVQRRQLLHEASVFRHNYMDSTYERAAARLGKALWLAMPGLAGIVLVALMLDRESYFLLGAAGGLMSRLSRVLGRTPEAADYGAEWSVLIISPIVGALAGWFGILIMDALASSPLNLLDDDLGGLWNDPVSVLGLSFAFLFGFSERLFNRLLTYADTKVGERIPETA